MGSLFSMDRGYISCKCPTEAKPYKAGAQQKKIYTKKSFMCRGLN